MKGLLQGRRLGNGASPAIQNPEGQLQRSLAVREPRRSLPAGKQPWHRASLAPAHSPTPSWIHDFPVTPNWAVVPETPVYYNLKVPPGPPCRARARPADPIPQTLPVAARNDRRAAAGRRRWWAARNTSCSTGCRSAARACT
jgi:hypothetical protein